MRAGVIGLGAMGGGIAENLIKKGFSVFVRDVRPEIVAQFTKKGATAASSSKELGSLCDVVLASLPMSPVEPTLENEILGAEGVLEGMEPHKIIIDCGNTSPLTAKKLYHECQKKGVSFLDAAVSGGPEVAQAGTLSVMVGGLPEVFEQVKPIFNAIGKKVTYFGSSGSGQMAKLINNMVVAINLAAISEALILGQKAGLDISKLREAMSSGAAQSWVLDTYGRIWLERVPGQRAVEEVYRQKQLGWAFEIGSELEVPLPVTTCVHELFKMARAAGKHGLCEPILELWEDMTGTYVSKHTK